MAAIEFANIVLTTNDAQIGKTPRDVVWTHRKSTLYRYRSAGRRRHAVPVLLVFALINRPDIFDLRPGNSFVEYLLEEGFDVFLLDWGEPDDEDADMGLDSYVCDEMPWGDPRGAARAPGQEEVSLRRLVHRRHAVRDARGARARGPRAQPRAAHHADRHHRRRSTRPGSARDSFDVDLVADAMPAIPGAGVDFANKLMKPVTNYWTTYRRLWDQVREGKSNRSAYQTMAKWVADNPPFPSRAYREWITWMYKENRLVSGTLRLRGSRVDLRRIDHNLLVVTAGADHIAPARRHGADLRPGLERGRHALRPPRRPHRPDGRARKARKEIWPDLATGSRALERYEERSAA